MRAFIIAFCMLCAVFKPVFVSLSFIDGMMLVGFVAFLALFFYWARKQPGLLVILLLTVVGVRWYLTPKKRSLPMPERTLQLPDKAPPVAFREQTPQEVCPEAASSNSSPTHANSWTPLKQAIFENDLQRVHTLLVRCGEDPNYAQVWHTALQYGGAEVIALLLDKGMTIPHDSSGVILQAYAGQAQAVAQAIQQGGLSKAEQEYLLPWAAAGGDVAVVNTLLAGGIIQNRNLALQSAVNTGRAEVVRLLAHGLTLNEKEQRTLMRYAVEKGHTEVAKTLLSLGIDVNITDPFHFGQTSLFVAARKGDFTMTQMLLAAEADPNVPDFTERETPLHVAVESGRIEVVRALVDAGADVNARNNRPQTPLQVAANKPEIAAYLREHGARE